MSVLKIIIADDQHYVSGEPHGSRAEWVYAACSRNPKSLEELDTLLPEFGANEDLRSFVGSWMADLDLEPVDAGLIIVDLAKKWIFAEDTYFGAHRRGSYSPYDDSDRRIEYEFSNEWQFVAEAKWFRYLHNLGLKPYGKPNAASYEKAEYEEISVDDFEFEDEPESTPARDEEEYGDRSSGFSVDYINRITSMVDFEPQNAEEQRDYHTLEHIAQYDEDAATAQGHIDEAQKEIASLKIELQAVENLWKRTVEPRWELKRIALQARIGQHEKRISRSTDDHAEAAAMAAELRTLLLTDNGRGMLKKWEERKKDGWEMEMPF